jgi:hypothetical protein
MAVTMAVSCVPSSPPLPGESVETRMSFLNFSTQFYAVLGVREHGRATNTFTYSPLLAPGAALRVDFLDLLDATCPGAVDLQILLYRRLNPTLPIGLDPGEAVEPGPVVAGQVEGVPACSVQTLETYTVVNWDAPEGVARVKIAQCSAVDEAIRAARLFPNEDAVWEVSGVDPAVAAAAQQAIGAPPAQLAVSPITGRVATSSGVGVPDVIVLLSPRVRSGLNCADPENPAESGYAEPIVYTLTDEQGRFEIVRPPGVYRLEFFSDDVAFRPGLLDVETPLDEIAILAEPLP